VIVGFLGRTRGALNKTDEKGEILAEEKTQEKDLIKSDRWSNRLSYWNSSGPRKGQEFEGNCTGEGGVTELGDGAREENYPTKRISAYRVGTLPISKSLQR